jgi:hypothetical protein
MQYFLKSKSHFFGEKLEASCLDYYLSNVIIEILQQTGIVGFTPYVTLL